MGANPVKRDGGKRRARPMTAAAWADIIEKLLRDYLKKRGRA